MLSVSSYPALHVRYNICNTYVSNKYHLRRALAHWSVGGFSRTYMNDWLATCTYEASKTKLSTAFR